MSDANPRNLDQFGIPLDRAGQTDPNDAIRSAFNDFLIEGDRQYIQVRGRANRWIISFQPDPVQPAEAGGGDEGSSSVATDFFVFVRKISGSYYRGVYKNSTLIKSFDHTDTLSVTGLLSSLTPDDSDPGWIATSTSDSIWIGVDIDASATPYVPSNAAIASLGNSDTFDGKELEQDGGMVVGATTVYSQTKARLVLADMGADINGNPTVAKQYVRSALRLGMTTLADGLKSDGTTPHLIVPMYFFAMG